MTWYGNLWYCNEKLGKCIINVIINISGSSSSSVFFSSYSSYFGFFSHRHLHYTIQNADSIWFEQGESIFLKLASKSERERDRERKIRCWWEGKRKHSWGQKELESIRHALCLVVVALTETHFHTAHFIQIICDQATMLPWRMVIGFLLCCCMNTGVTGVQSKGTFWNVSSNHFSFYVFSTAKFF